MIWHRGELFTASADTEVRQTVGLATGQHKNTATFHPVSWPLAPYVEAPKDWVVFFILFPDGGVQGAANGRQQVYF
jgi:hypothetical protein